MGDAGREKLESIDLQLDLNVQSSLLPILCLLKYRFTVTAQALAGLANPAA
jgi:hypothetical protein